MDPTKPKRLMSWATTMTGPDKKGKVRTLATNVAKLLYGFPFCNSIEFP